MLKLPIRVGSAIRRYGFAVVAVILASLLRAAIARALGEGTPFILFYPTVVLAAWFGGFWPGLLSTVCAGFIAWYFFIPPYYSFALSEPTAPAQLIVFLLSGTLISSLAESLHRARRISQQREASEREERERFRVTFDSIGDAVIATDAQGRVNFMNRVAEFLTGWSRNEVSEKRLGEVFNIINEQTRQPVENPALRALEHGLIVGLANHSVLIAKDGIERAIDDSAAPIRTVTGGTIGAVLIFRDISERRAAEREIWESRERLRTTLGSIGDAVVATDPEGRVTYVNPVAEQLLAYRSEQASGRPLGEIFKIVNEFTRRPAENPVERVLRDGHVVGLANHTMLLRPDGIEVPIDDSAAPIQNDARQIFGVVLVFRDITERRRAQRAQATLAAIVESSEDAIISKDLDGRIMTWNAGAERLFGYRQEEAIGHPISLIIPADHIHEETVILQRIRNGERVEPYETVRVRKDGTHVNISLTVSPVKSPDGDVIGASKIARDITDRKRIEQQLVEADQHKDNFLAILAHELRNPLGPIRNAAKIIEIQRPNDRDLLYLSDLIEKEVVQITRLLDDLLDVSRITRGKFSLKKQRIDLAAVVNRAIETSRPMIDQAEHKITVNLSREPLMVDADPMRLAQVFCNLLNNASKFTQAGGDIRITVERQESQAVVTVKDTGIGISHDLLPKIFDMFVQGSTATERAYGGLGLGLTLARDIVELHGGHIAARSAGPGHGSDFIVSLPLSEISSSSDVIASIVHRQSPAEQLRTRIVVIDDNRDQALSLQGLLEAMGHEVRIAYDGSSAMKLLESFVPDFALIDLGLPEINGYDFARWVRGQLQFRHTVLIAQTGWGREEDRNRARDAGFIHHLVKPVDYQQLVQILARSGSNRQD
jgi:PAS domain S-box-containing protein